MQITFNNISAQIELETGDNPKNLASISKQFSTLAPGVQFIPTYRKYQQTGGHAGWDGKVYFIDKNGTIPTGFLPQLIAAIWNTTKAIPTVIDNRRIASQLQLNTVTVPLRDYQWDAVGAAFHKTEFGTWFPRGVLKIATGGGKTECAAAMIQAAAVPSLFLVHRKDLLLQAKDRLEKYNIQTGVVGSGVINPSNITVSTMQTIGSLIRNERWDELEFLKDIEQVFFDEAHLLAADLTRGNLFVKIAGLLENAYMRWGLTATPFMKDQYSNWLLEGVTGPIIHEIKSSELIKEGWLVQPEIKIFKSPKVPCKSKWPDAYDNGIVLNDGRNKLIVDLLSTFDSPRLVLISQVSHGVILQRKIAKMLNKDVPFLDGSQPAKVRKDVVSQLRNGTIDTVIASTIFDEGIDIPELRTLILAGAGKSQIKMLQRIGRGLRIASNKTKVTVVDFFDESCTLLKKHSESRMHTWLSEGFTVEVK